MFKKRFLALICGLVFSLGFAPLDLWVLSILSISVLLNVLNEHSKKESFLIGYLFGFGMWLTGISWLYVSIHYHGNVSIIGSAFLILIFISILSLYSGLLFLLHSYLKLSNFSSLRLLSLPVAWVVIELLRSYLFTGFPWLISGTMLADTLVDGFTPIIGAQGNSFYLVLMSSCIYEIFTKRDQRRSPLLFSFFLIFTVASSYFLKSFEWTNAEDEIFVSLHQPNLTLEEKWSQPGIIHTQGMIYKAIEMAEEGELIVFPETALILSEKDNKSFIETMRLKASQKNITLISGIVEREEDYTMKNRLQAFGETNTYYDKLKLVPFGEFIPFQQYLGSFLDIIGLNLTNTLPGDSIRPINKGKYSISPSICYEIAFDELIRKTAKDSQLLLTVSNDTWFGESLGPIQHLEIAQNRALEHKKPLIRATNSGISAIISQNGEIIERQGYFEEKVLKNSIMLYSGNTFYSNYGRLPILIFIAIYLSLIILKNTFLRKFDK